MEHVTEHVPQDGLYVKVQRGTGTVRFRGAGATSELVARLPEHPDEQHVKANGDPTYVLPWSVAEAVLTPLELPSDPEKDLLYLRSAQAVGQTSPFVHVVWFTPEGADRITRRGPGAHLRATRELHDTWRSLSMSQTCGSSNQPAAGVYTELGVGTMAGTARTSVSVAGTGTSVPFSRNAHLSDTLEPVLSEFLSDVSAVLHASLPAGTLQDHEVDSRSPAEACMCYQYPRLRQGAPPLRVHQIALRGPKSGESDREAYMSISDLHVDPCDGGGSTGTVTVHTCHAHAQNAPMASAAESREQLRLRGLAVFPLRNGGRGVHINSMVPGWHCAMVMQTSERLHGSIQADEHLPRGFGLPDFRLMRVVTYPLRSVERLLERLAEDPHAWPAVLARSDEWMQQRAAPL